MAGCGGAAPAAQPTPRMGALADQVPVRLTPAPNVQGNPVAGRALFATKGCAGCHGVVGMASANGITGPNLSNVTLRPRLANEAIENNPETMVKWIMDPPAMKPGTAMPKLGVNEQEARDLAAFLYSLPYNPGR